MASEVEEVPIQRDQRNTLLSRCSAVQLWCACFGAFFLVLGSWSLATPYNGAPDELHHVVRAAGVVEGQLTPAVPPVESGRRIVQRVSAGLYAESPCWRFQPMKSVACAPEPTANRTKIDAPTGAGRYFPPYYAIVGWPLKWWPGWSGILVSRLLTAAMASALLAGAMTALIRRPSVPLMLTALVISCTPQAAFIASSVNPNGLEIAGGVAFFTGLLALLRGLRGEEVDAALVGAHRGAIWLTGFGGLALALTRPTGLLALAVGATAGAILIGLKTLLGLARFPLVRAWVAVLGLGSLASLVWTLTVHSDQIKDVAPDTYSRTQIWILEAERWRNFIDTAIGVPSWLDVRMPSSAYLVWSFCAAAIVLSAIVVGGRRERLQLVTLLVGCVAVPSLMEIKYVNDVGLITQGRYLLPILSGLVLFSAHVLHSAGDLERVGRSSVRITLVPLLCIHLLCLTYAMSRWQHGIRPFGKQGTHDLNPLRGNWHPVVGSWTPLLMQIVGLCLLGALCWASTRVRSVPERTPAGGGHAAAS